MSNFCIECRFYRGCDVDGETPVCHNFMPFGKTTLFDRLSASMEVLAEAIIYPYQIRIAGGCEDDWKEYWVSPLTLRYYPTKPEAIAATVIAEELLEVNTAALKVMQNINDQASRDELLTELAQLNATTIRMMEKILNS